MFENQSLFFHPRRKQVEHTTLSAHLTFVDNLRASFGENTQMSFQREGKEGQAPEGGGVSWLEDLTYAVGLRWEKQGGGLLSTLLIVDVRTWETAHIARDLENEQTKSE